MSENMSENLSKTLFSYKYNSQETTGIIANSSSKKNHKIDDVIMDGEEKEGWYRLFKFLQWSWRGLNFVETAEIIARIAASTNNRTDDQLLDSVIGFRSGNWSYEWTQVGMVHQKAGAVFAKAGENEKAKESYYLASQFYANASYPHLKTDELSIQAQVLACSSYRKLFEYNKNAILKEVKFQFQKKEVTCFLHLPNDEHIHPVVIVSGALDTLQCEFFKLFEDHLAPAGVAMVTIDLPGTGYSSHVKLDQDSSDLYQALIEHLKTVAWVDHDRIGILGSRFGGNIATRLAFLEPKMIKAVVAIGAPVASLFDNYESFKKLPPILLDCLASRMQAPDSDPQTLFQRSVPFSLVKQGLLFSRRIKTPIFSISHKDDVICNATDIKLIARGSVEGKSYIIDKDPIFASYMKAISQSAKWLTDHLQE